MPQVSLISSHCFNKRDDTEPLWAKTEWTYNLTTAKAVLVVTSIMWQPAFKHPYTVIPNVCLKGKFTSINQSLAFKGQFYSVPCLANYDRFCCIYHTQTSYNNFSQVFLPCHRFWHFCGPPMGRKQTQLCDPVTIYYLTLSAQWQASELTTQPARHPRLTGNVHLFQSVFDPVFFNQSGLSIIF